MKRLIYLLPAFALYLASCSDEVTVTDGGNDGQTPAETSNLTTVKLATFNGDASRITYTNGTRADGDELKPGELKLVASIANPNKEVFSGTTGSRLMSATSVYYDAKNDIYYTTYHVQGNNYNTTLNVPIGGAIESFKVDADGTVIPGKGYKAANTNKLDFDFNHIYFDNTDSRIIVVGHQWTPYENGNPDPNFENTRAIIGKFDPENGTLTEATIATEKKMLDSNGKSLGDEDAGDANCVIRPNDQPEYSTGYNGYPIYIVTTRKGIAVLHADQENLFKPVLNKDNNSRYFIPTPGSSKYVYDIPRVGSMFGILYLSENTKNESYITSSAANIAKFQIAHADGYWLMNPNAPETFYNSSELDIVNYKSQIELPVAISPIDGKNSLCVLEDYEYYAALGTTGMYYQFKGAITTNKDYAGVKKFGNRPVNFVVTDTNENNEGIGEGYDRTSHDGFIYVANGAKLTILHRRTLEEVASYNIPAKDADGNDIASSANYITVRKMPKGENGLCERIITVAFGQEGVKIFKFMPTTKTVWEKELN